MRHLAIIDFLRGYSIFTIVLMHLLLGNVNGIFAKGILFGGAGVHVFILCSGFGLYLSYLKKPLGYIDFLKRRLGKVWVPYAIVVLLWGVWYASTKGFFPVREVMSHLLLYKMFSAELDVSLCYPYWFISTIVQFYLFWPLIVRLFRLNGGGIFMLLLSLVWSTIVGLLGLQDQRPCGSFFMQYLWEFGLGMWAAEKCMKGKKNHSLFDISSYKWWWLIAGAIGGMGTSAFMAWSDGLMKLYNDIPSLFGYLSLALIIYKINIGFINKFYEWSNRFSYELYLLHMLVFALIAYMVGANIPLAFRLTICFVLAYLASWSFWMIVNKLTT